MDTLVQSAMTFAMNAHEGQKRKYSGEPYIIHPCEVAALCHEAGIRDSEVLAAAWLHDVVEDCGVSLVEIYHRFGPHVELMVFELTDPTTPSYGNRAERKAAERAHLAEATADSKSVKLADLISNTRSIVRDDPKFAKQYLREKALLLPKLREGSAYLYNIASQQLETHSEALYAS